MFALGSPVGGSDSIRLGSARTVGRRVLLCGSKLADDTREPTKESEPVTMKAAVDERVNHDILEGRARSIAALFRDGEFSRAWESK